MANHFLITKQIVVEYQMLVHADNIVQAQLKALAGENQDRWREVGPREIWQAESLLPVEDEDEEYPGVVE